MISPFESTQVVRSQGITLSLVMVDEPIATVTVAQPGDNEASFHQALRLGIVGSHVLSDDHVSWLRSLRDPVEEWIATQERIG